MILHVLDRARESKSGRAIVCTDDENVLRAVTAAGGEAVLTRTDHPSGSDRIWEAVSKVDPRGEVETIINLQGDLPTINPALIAASAALLEAPGVAIGTLATEITDKDEIGNPNVVKVIGSPVSPSRLRALYFSRATAPWGAGPLYHHIGMYAYRRDALERYVSLPPSVLEKREKLEQLRALEDGMRIDVALVDTAPLGVDTPEDLKKARAILAR